MENLKHTKGEWTTQKCSNGGLIVCLGDTKDWSIQRVQIANEANAKLIAAAPDLLDALIDGEKELRELYNTVDFEGKFPVRSTLDKMINAIKKATNE